MYGSTQFSNQPQQPLDGPKMNWWLRLASWQGGASSASYYDRDKVRRSQLSAWLIMGVAIVVVLLLPVGIGDFGTLVSLMVVALGLVVAALFNRAGNVSAAGVLLVILICGAVFGALLSLPDGLSTDSLPAYDLLAIAVVVGASVIRRSAAFTIAILNCVLISADFFLQPHDVDLRTDIISYGDPTVAAATLLLRPIALQVILAVVSYLWVRGVEEAIRRADRAEELAALEHAIAEQKAQLDVGIQQILATHVRVANGDFTARAPTNQENLLWQIAASLNNLLGRLQRAGMAEARLSRTEEELRHLESALRDARDGRPPRWPAPSGTGVDGIVQLIAPNAAGSARGVPPPQQGSRNRWGEPSQPVPDGAIPPQFQQQRPNLGRANPGMPDSGSLRPPMSPAGNPSDWGSGWPQERGDEVRVNPVNPWAQPFQDDDSGR